MSRRSKALAGVAATALLFLGTTVGRADPDVDGNDHSKLNHGVLGPEPQHRVSAGAPDANETPTPAAAAERHEDADHAAHHEPQQRASDDAGPKAATRAPGALAERHDPPERAAKAPEPAAKPSAGAAKTDERIARALIEADRALDSARYGDTEGVARHVEEAAREAQISERATHNPHAKEAIEHLTAAAGEARKSNLDAALKHAQEAIGHLKEAKKS